MIRGRQRSTLLEQKLMSTLLDSVNIENHINMDGHQSISFVNGGGRRMLTNFNQNIPNICKVEPDILNLGTQTTGLLSEIKETYEKLLEINNL